MKLHSGISKRIDGKFQAKNIFCEGGLISVNQSYLKCQLQNFSLPLKFGYLKCFGWILLVLQEHNTEEQSSTVMFTFRIYFNWYITVREQGKISENSMKYVLVTVLFKTWWIFQAARLQNSRTFSPVGRVRYFLASLPILPRRFHTCSRPPCIRILTVARVGKKYDCFAVYQAASLHDNIWSTASDIV